MKDLADKYRTVEENTSAILRSKGSKFCAYLYPAHNEGSIQMILERIRSDHPKADHLCYAYRIGRDPLKEFQTDDREPSGSAGLPILRALQSADLKNCLLAVVRYFGGTKLGVPGLINAYRESSLASIDTAAVVEKIFMEQLRIWCAYEHMNALYRIINEFDGKVLPDTKAQDPLHLILKLPVSKCPDLIDRLENTYPLNKNLRIIKD